MFSNTSLQNNLCCLNSVSLKIKDDTGNCIGFIFSCKVQLNTCTCALSVRPSVVKPEFLTVWSADEDL